MKKEKSKKTITISIPLILILVVGVIILSIVTSYAATMVFDSNNVNYDNTTSGIRSSNVQGAIDELYACASNYSAYDTRLTDTEDIIGNTTLSTTAPTLTGGVNELNDQIEELQFVKRFGNYRPGSSNTLTISIPKKYCQNNDILELFAPVVYVDYSVTPPTVDIYHVLMSGSYSNRFARVTTNNEKAISNMAYNMSTEVLTLTFSSSVSYASVTIYLQKP